MPPPAKKTMSNRPAPPSFARPPVIEVALSVQFGEPLPLRVVDYGRLWDSFSKRYAEVQEQAPLPHVIEAFGEGSTSNVNELVQTITFPRAPVRLWFVSRESDALVQVQADRFVFNWRKSEAAPTYRRYKWVSEQFLTEYTELLRSLDVLNIASPVAELCEVTYVNHIVAGDGWNHHEDLDKLFPALRIPKLTIAESRPEEAEVQIRFATVDSKGKSGRLHFRVYPAVRQADGVKLYVVNLVARARPSSASADHVRDCLQDGHDWVVSAFKDVTSPAMHEIWGLENVIA